MELMKLLGRGFAGLGLLMTILLLAGCQTDTAKYKFDPLAGENVSSGGTTTATAPAAPVDATQTTVHRGDSLTVTFADTPTPIVPIEDTVKEDGSITLIYNERFQAEGKTVGTLQQEIRERYVPKYFKYLTVSIRPQERFYFVGGEVRTPNRFAYVGRMTVLSAIDTAGGFNEFAKKSKVQVTRANGKSFNVDCRDALAHPEKNVEIFPGDKIHVPKRAW